MNTRKKLILGLGLFFATLLWAGSFILSDKTFAAAAGQKEWGACASLVEQGFGASCKLGGNGDFPPYGGVDFNTFTGATFQASYNETGAAPATRIIVLNSSLQPLISDTGYSNFVYSTKGTFNAGTLTELKYYVYRPLNNSDYVLVTSTDNKTPKIYALIYNQLNDGGGTFGGNDFVYAWKVDKVSLASTSTGGTETGSGGAGTNRGR
ncbi:hypothetical protein HYU82_00860 [Candidatus Saccharibacteria bacterium]|nr:hypothetical protein [Candidatus Saccharibacteria bacterium]